MNASFQKQLPFQRAWCLYVLWHLRANFCCNKVKNFFFLLLFFCKYGLRLLCLKQIFCVFTMAQLLYMASAHIGLLFSLYPCIGSHNFLSTVKIGNSSHFQLQSVSYPHCCGYENFTFSRPHIFFVHFEDGELDLDHLRFHPLK